MAAARWDIEWERGGFWRARLVRRAKQSGVLIGLTAPCSLEVRGLDDPSTEPALLAVQATIADDHAYADLLVTEQQVMTLPRDRYQHRILVGDLATGRPLVMLRGYVTINDQVGG